MALYYESQAGRLLAQVIPVGDNDYGGFACLRPFIEDPDQRYLLKQALGYLSKAQSFAPNQAHSYYLTGRSACLLGDYEGAVTAFQRFAELRPHNPSAYLEMGFALVNACPPNGKCANLNAYDTWRKAGVTAEQFLKMADAERRKENYAEALLWYQSAQRMGRELRSTIAYLRYLNFQKAGDTENANKALQSAIEMDRGWLDEEIKILALNDYGFFLFYSKNDCTKASKIFSKIINITNNICENYPFQVSSAHFHIGVCLYYNHEYKNALNALSKALECGSNYSWMQIWFGKALYMVDPNNKTSAAEHFIRGLELSNDNINYWKEVIFFWIEHEEKGLASDFCDLANKKNIMHELHDVCDK
jgi:tetratricopeptide (TPR) repeat protein